MTDSNAVPSSPGARLGALVALILALSTGIAAQAPAAPAMDVVAAADRLAASGRMAEVRMEAACWSDGPYREVRIFGSGVGIWNRAAQFSVPPGEIETLLRAFRKADFDHMPVAFGGTVDPDEARRGPKIICQTSLTAGQQTKEVVQLEKGTQSKPLWTLATTILDLSEKRAATATTAASVEDGLAKIVAGQLAPDTLDLTVHHRTERTAGRDPNGWVLQVNGRSATVDAYGDAATARRQMSLRLTAGELADLVRTLTTEKVAALPGNLYFADYTDVHIGVLNREHQIQARRFSGMAPDTQARGRALFERLLAAFTALHRRVLEDGEPVK